jgi:hypothetical protein
LKWDDVPCFPLRGFKLLVWFLAIWIGLRFDSSLTSEWGFWFFLSTKPEWRRYGSQASNFVSLYNIYILWASCVLEWSLHGWNLLEKLIGSLWKCAWLFGSTWSFECSAIQKCVAAFSVFGDGQNHD